MEINDFVKIAPLSAGKFGEIELLKRSDAPKYYIKKTLHIRSYSSDNILEALTEIHILKNLKSPFIIKYKGFRLENERLSILMEFACGGDLYNRVALQKSRKMCFKEELVLDWITEIALGLYYLHEKNVLHCDIKLENIFLTAFGDVKIGDFGIAKILEKKDDQIKMCFGTPYYMSPELCEKQIFSKESDIWSLGCVFYYLLALNPPFDGENLEELMSNIRFNKFNEKLLKPYSIKTQSLLFAMLQKNREERISIVDILKTDIIYERIDGLIKRTKENETKFKKCRAEMIERILTGHGVDFLKIHFETDKEY